MTKPVIILGIESSCDDTSAAILKDRKILSNIIANQEVHKKYGGVVPELASRAHQQNIIPVVNEAINQAKIKKEDIDAVAYTKGPGLLGSLLVGGSFAKGFAMGMKIPLISVNHMKGHILAHFIENQDSRYPRFPFLCLTVSGGHTQLVRINDFNDMKIIGTTLDDAAGEAFDKSARLLGLDYPGGPLIDKLSKNGDIKAFQFGKPKIKDLDFSFSGFKTSIVRLVEKGLDSDKDFVKNNLNDLCASIQHSIVEILIEKIKIASKKENVKEIAIAGGVAANSYLRKRLDEESREENFQIHIPKFEYCTDNAAMIAISGLFKYQNNDFSSQSEVSSSRLLF